MVKRHICHLWCVTTSMLNSSRSVFDAAGLLLALHAAPASISWISSSEIACLSEACEYTEGSHSKDHLRSR
ncbi:hypothetical protein TNCV_2360771 [Trichonephila clavipes]|nr:hypothetical protein TNCV_2360771 [Trichonephila clavipes]